MAGVTTSANPRTLSQLIYSHLKNLITESRQTKGGDIGKKQDKKQKKEGSDDPFIASLDTWEKRKKGG